NICIWKFCMFVFEAGWDQSKIKVYITLNGVRNIIGLCFCPVTMINVSIPFISSSTLYFALLVKYFDGKNHQMTINNFLHPIDVQDSSKKVLNTYLFHLGI
uniref:CS domain-containing protein n=1 Tax=Hucho hucho TaxID=62062 RepID=A0A4W5Q4H9_9TELE